MVFEHSSYRTYLESWLATRRKRNKAFSTRAMAAKLGLTQSFLSEVLGAKKNFSLEMALKVAKRLALEPAEAEYFCTLVQLEKTRHASERVLLIRRANILNPRSRFQELDLERFKAIADWHHFAIRELVENEEQPVTPARLSRRLGISESVAQEALTRLLNLNLIVPRAGGRGHFSKSEPTIRVTSSSPTVALRKFHGQMLLRAIDSLEKQGTEEKYIGSETFSFQPSDLPEAARLTEEYFSRMVQLTAGAGGPGRRNDEAQVYHLGVQFFRLTQPTRGLSHV